MIKLVYCLRRKESVPPEQFFHYWLGPHGRLVESFANAMNARRYVQSHTCAPDINALLMQSRSLAPAYDGITEIWWDSADALRAAMATPEGAAAMQRLIEDESTFIDLAQSRAFMTEEHTIFDIAAAHASISPRLMPRKPATE